MFREVEREDQYTLLCVHSPPVSDEWVAYTDYIGGLLNSRPVYQHRLVLSGDHQGPTIALESPDENPQEPSWPAKDARAGTWADTTVVHPPDFSLVAIADSQPSWWQRLFWRPPAYRALNQIPGSILFVRNPRWPLRKILVVVRVHDSDGLSLAWAERLALSSGAKVTLMPIVPPHPRLHQHDSKMLQGLDVLMVPYTISGEAIYCYARHLDQLGLRGTVSRRQGPPEHQIYSEAREAGHDLIIIADEPFGRWSRWFLGDLVRLLLGVSERPVLVAR